MFLALSKVVLGEEFSLVHESCASRELSVPCELMAIGSHLGGPSLSGTHYGEWNAQPKDFLISQWLSLREI